MAPYNWQSLAIVDCLITRDLVDTERLKSHKVVSIVTRSCERKHKNTPLFRNVLESYRSSQESVCIRHVSQSFSNDHFTSFGVFASKKLPYKLLIPGLIGFLAPFPKHEIVEGVNDFSVFRSA